MLRLLSLTSPEYRIRPTIGQKTKTNIGLPIKLSPERTMKKPFSPEVSEIVEFLSRSRYRYAIFAGFASHLLTGVESSNDVDVLFSKEADCREIAESFASRGWIPTKDCWETPEHLNIVLNKKETEFDLVYSTHAVQHLLDEPTIVDFGGSRVLTLSREAMLLVKINQMTKPDRSPEKVFRDRNVINILRKQVDILRITALAGQLGSRYWTEGRF